MSLLPERKGSQKSVHCTNRMESLSLGFEKGLPCGHAAGHPSSSLSCRISLANTNLWVTGLNDGQKETGWLLAWLNLWVWRYKSASRKLWSAGQCGHRLGAVKGRKKVRVNSREAGEVSLWFLQPHYQWWCLWVSKAFCTTYWCDKATGRAHMVTFLVRILSANHTRW